MSDFSDLKKLRQILDQLDPPMVMVGRCQTCKHWGPEADYYHDGARSCGSDGAGGFVIGYHDDYATPPDFGCVRYSVKPKQV